MRSLGSSNSAITSITSVCLLLALGGFAYPQTALRSTDAPLFSQKSLDNQLLEGLGDDSKHDRVAPTEVPGRDSDGRVPDGVIDPFAGGSDLGQQNPLVTIEQQMRLVEGLLRQRIVSDETQLSQRQIVERLDDLIAALAASQQASRKRRPGASSQGNQQSSKTGKQASRDGSGRPADGGAETQSAASFQRAAGEVWGHLPDRLRRQMRSAGAIEFLPKYRKLIEDYYKRLAEDRGIQQ